MNDKGKPGLYQMKQNTKNVLVDNNSRVDCILQNIF